MYADDLAAFLKACDEGNTGAAVGAARRMNEASREPLSTRDALRLVVLFARDEDARFPKAGARWITMLKRAGVPDELVEVAVPAVKGLLGSPAISRRCERVLVELIAGNDILKAAEVPASDKAAEGLRGMREAIPKPRVDLHPGSG